MTANELRALKIGVSEAYKNNIIVPAAESEEMRSFMRELSKDLIPVIKAYNVGLAIELAIQIRLGTVPLEMKEKVAALLNI